MEGSEVVEPCLVIETLDLLDSKGHDRDERPRCYWRVEEVIFVFDRWLGPRKLLEALVAEVDAAPHRVESPLPPRRVLTTQRFEEPLGVIFEKLELVLEVLLAH